jgi:hypothetical protein
MQAASSLELVFTPGPTRRHCGDTQAAAPARDGNWIAAVAVRRPRGVRSHAGDRPPLTGWNPSPVRPGRAGCSQPWIRPR